MEKYLIDFDGVILDSQQRFQMVMKDNINLYDWIEYLVSIEWYSFLRECNEIDDSISVLQQLQRCEKLKAILTTIHSFKEGEEKLNFLREKEIQVPIIYTLPNQRKSEVVIPRNELILIDDKEKNCIDWRLNGGIALQFDPYLEVEEEGKIKTLKKLL